MGWTFDAKPTTKADFIARLRRDYESGGHTVLDHKVVGKECWWLLQLSATSRDAGRVIIAVDLLDRHGGCWGSKGMDESVHPFFYACPLSWLDRAPVENADWRAGVRKWHADRAAIKSRRKALAVGVAYRVPEGWKIYGRRIVSLVLSSLKPAQGTAALEGADTVPCRVSRRLLDVLDV